MPLAIAPSPYLGTKGFFYKHLIIFMYMYI